LTDQKEVGEGAGSEVGFAQSAANRLRAKEMFLRGHAATAIARAIGVHPNLVRGWRKAEGWDVDRESLFRAIRKQQLRRIKKDAAAIYSELDRHYVGLLNKLLKNTEEYKREDGTKVRPLVLTSAEETYRIILKLLADRRALVDSTVGLVSESYPLIEPEDVSLVTASPPRVPDPDVPAPVDGGDVARDNLEKTGNLLPFKKEEE
jgi:transposase-like protein